MAVWPGCAVVAAFLNTPASSPTSAVSENCVSAAWIDTHAHGTNSEDDYNDEVQ